ncbi:MAG TPA: HAMP domain-containing sensor histidine kinase [Anaeromyxobacter sp.]|nr:HAMP domain-containing sensor histidine kinase [Anaeromyxobacter sp.]
MTLQRRIALFLLAASVAPLVGVGFAVLSASQRELARRAAAEHEARARSGAASIAAALADVDASLGALTETWRPDRLSYGELRGMLLVLSRQVPSSDAGVVADADGSARAVLGEGSATATRAFVDAVRAAKGAPLGSLVLRAYDDPERGWQLAAARAVTVVDGRDWLVGVRLSTQFLRRPLDAAVPDGGAAYLADGARVLLASTGAGPIGAEQRAELAGRLDPTRPGAVQGDRVLAAWAPLGDGTGWGVLVVVPAERAYAAVRSMRRGVLVASLAVLGAVLLVSGVAARGTIRGLGRIDAAARALGAGDLAVRLPEGGRDEIAAVSRTFNAMAGELQEARGRLERWNEELRREVEARTRELALAQAQLGEERKLAAIGRLGAGVAHEINNPLTGILGHAQLLLERAAFAGADREPLQRIEALARRCRDVTQALLRFSQRAAEPAREDVDLNRVVADALALFGGLSEAEGVPVSSELASPPPRVRGDAGRLARVLLNLLANARTACQGRPGAAIAVSTARDGEEAVLRVRDGGRGISPEHLPHVFEPFFTTKDRWASVGLGLSVSYRIVAEHGGRIEVESRPGEGAAFTVRLPAVPAATV